jgi:hypothetical protein
MACQKLTVTTAAPPYKALMQAVPCKRTFTGSGGDNYYNSYIRLAHGSGRGATESMTLQRFDFLSNAVLYSTRDVDVAGRPSSSCILNWHDDVVLASDTGTSHVLDATSLQVLGTHMRGVGVMPRIDPRTNRLLSMSLSRNASGRSVILLCEHLADNALYILHTLAVDAHVLVDDFGFTRSNWIMLTNEGGRRVGCIVVHRATGRHQKYAILDDDGFTTYTESRIAYARDACDGGEQAKFMMRTHVGAAGRELQLFVDVHAGCVYPASAYLPPRISIRAPAIDFDHSGNAAAILAPSTSPGISKLSIRRNMDKDTDTLHVVQEFKRDGWTFDDDEPVLVGDHAIVICHDRTASNMLIFEKANMAEPVSTLCFDARIPAGGRGAWVRTHFR